MTVADIQRIGSPAIAREDARRASLEYRRAVRLEHVAARRRELEALWRGYRAIARGAHVIDLYAAMTAAGLQPDTLYPRLAIVRADATHCWLTLNGDGSALFATTRWRRRAHGGVVELPAGTFPTWIPSWFSPDAPGPRRPRDWTTTARALAPLIPPALRPAASLTNYHVLFDAVWTAAPPVDPLLVRHLGGALWAIVAAWDLTPLEQAVLRGRLVDEAR